MPGQQLHSGGIVELYFAS